MSAGVDGPRGCAFISSLAAAAAIACGGTATEVVTGPSDSTPRCAVSLGAPPPTVPAAGANITLSVITTRDCTWNASSEASWLRVSPAIGQGEASLTLAVAENERAVSRSAEVVVSNQRATVSQEPAPCRYALSHHNAQIGPEGGRATVGVAAAAECTWTAASDASWASVLTSSGSGTGTVVADVEANPGGQRSARVTVADQTLTVTQGAFRPAPDPGNPQPPPAQPPVPPPTAPPPPPPSSPAATLINGGFEQGATGWNMSGVVKVFSNAGGWQSSEGSSGVVFNSGQTTPDCCGGRGTIWQGFTTATGQGYELTFDAGAYSRTDQYEQRITVTVQSDATVLSSTVSTVTAGPGSRYDSFRFSFVAGSSSTVLTFQDASSNVEHVDLLLDNVRVTPR